KPIVRNWTRYWAGTLAISGMLVMGACGSDTERRTADETTTETSVPARDNVSNREVADDELNTTATVDAQQNPASTTTTDQTDQTNQTTTNTTSSRSGSRWSGSSVSNIDKHVEKFSEVNEAIEQSLSEIAGEGDASNMAQQDPNMQGNQDMARENEQTGVTYDNMSNQDVAADEQTDDQYAADQNATDVEGTEGVEMETTATEETDQPRNNMVNTEQQSTTYQDMNNAEDVDNEANADVDVDAEVEGNAGVDVDADAAVDVETDANTATGIDVDADADVDADVETGLEDTDVNMETEEVTTETDMQTGVTTDDEMNTSDRDAHAAHTQDHTGVATDNMSNTSAEFDDMFDDIEDTEQYNALELARMNPNLSTFVSMVEQAGLTATFEGEGPVTIFAPTNQAFEEMSQERRDELSDPAKLAEVLNLHVLNGEEVSTAMLNSRSYIDRGEEDGVEITTELDGTQYIVGGARVVKSDIQIANGVLHVVDGILETSPDAGPGPGLD
ncbi:MAG: fasciclin domain-containing protein, partial [Bacteroidetes bacterium]|nr:fasciclin domain-containing protein [Bacteroidota bacterium]